MSKSQKPRKAYKPKPISRIGGIGSIAAIHDRKDMAGRMGDDQVADLARAYRMAFANMTGGHANEEQWSTCVCSLNIAVVLTEMGYGPEYEPQIVEAMEGAFLAKQRAIKTGRWGFDGGTMNAIKLAYEVHEAQLEAATKADLKAAVLEVRRRVDAGSVFRFAA